MADGSTREETEREADENRNLYDGLFVPLRARFTTFDEIRILAENGPDLIFP
jgi:hypothetical protein